MGRGILTKLRDHTEAEHTALLFCSETRWHSRVKVFHGVFELREETAIFKR